MYPSQLETAVYVGQLDEASLGFDAGVETLVADKLTIIEERILREDANGASTQLLTLEAQWAPKFTPLAEIVKRIGPKSRLLRNGRSSRVALLMPDRTRLMDDGTPVASFTLYRPNGRSWLTAAELAESHWDDCEPGHGDAGFVGGARLICPGVAPVDDLGAHPLIFKGSDWRLPELFADSIQPQAVISLRALGQF